MEDFSTLLIMTARLWKLINDPQAELATPTLMRESGVESGLMFTPPQNRPGTRGGRPGQDVLSRTGSQASPWTFCQLIL